MIFVLEFADQFFEFEPRVIRRLVRRLWGVVGPDLQFQRTLELKIKNETPQPPDEAAAYARQELEKLIRQFDNDTEPYRSLNLPMWASRYGSYDDLARIKEWSAAGGLGIEEW